MKAQYADSNELGLRVSETLWELLEYCGGNPRYEEYVLVALSTWNCRDPDMITNYFNLKKVDLPTLLLANNQHFSSEEKNRLLTTLLDEIERRTRIKDFIDLDHDAIKYLLACELLNKPVTRNDKIGKYTVEDLEAQGLIFLSASRQQFFVSIPYFSFYFFYRQQKLNALRLLQTDLVLEWRSNEISDVSIILGKLTLIRDVLKQKTFQLKDIFPYRDGLKDMAFYVPNGLRYKIFDEDFSKKSDTEFENILAGMTQDDYCAGLGSQSSSFPDSWIVVKSVKTEETYILFIQSKRRMRIGEHATPGKEVKESVEKEHEKCIFYRAS